MKRNLIARQAARISSWTKRFIRARELGIPYIRDKLWQTPSTIRLNGIAKPLLVPQDQGTRIAFKDIFLDDVYGLRRIRRPIDTILDVGAHAGLFSLHARSCFPHAIIHAYEPNPALWNNLQHQAKIGGFTAFPFAIGPQSGRVHLHVESDSVLTQAVIADDGETPMTSIIDAIGTLGGYVDILKLDCEGAEWAILTRRDSLSRVAFLTLEYHLTAQHPLEDLFTLVGGQGFQILFHHADGINNGRVWASRV